VTVSVEVHELQVRVPDVERGRVQELAEAVPAVAGALVEAGGRTLDGDEVELAVAARSMNWACPAARVGAGFVATSSTGANRATVRSVPPSRTRFVGLRLRLKNQLSA
jgi:hypothetical protein